MAAKARATEDAARSEGRTVTRGYELQIRAMEPGEITLAADWAAAEGWNPGRADAACFASVDPRGFLIGECEGEPAATISCVNYDDGFAFLGFYIVRPDLRGRGYGLRIWNAAMAHAGARTVGLDGVVAQQDNYRKSGFQLAYPNVRYGGTVGLFAVAGGGHRAACERAVRSRGGGRRDGLSRRRARRSCAPGSTPPGTSAARSSATAGLPPGA